MSLCTDTRSSHSEIIVSPNTPEVQYEERVDHLWRHLKRDVLANEPLPDLDATLKRAWCYLAELSPRERLRKAGVLSARFWLRDAFPAKVRH